MRRVAVPALAGSVLAAGAALALAGVSAGAPTAGERADAAATPRIVLADGGVLYAVEPDGGGRTRLTPDDARTWSGGPAASRDARRLAFLRFDDRTAGDWAGGLHVMDADGGDERRVVTSSWNDPATGPVHWSPDGRRLAFRRLTDVGSGGIPRGDCADLFVVDLVTDRERRLATTHEASWSPDGRRLAYVAAGDCNATRRERIAVRALAGGAARVLAVGRSPDWAARGGRIAYIRGGDVFVVAAAGGTPRRLTRARAADSHPRWSPDGRRLAFVRHAGFDARGVDRTWIVVVRADGSGLRRVGRADAGTAPPAWSPAGDRLAWEVRDGVVVAPAHGRGPVVHLGRGNSPTWVR